MAKKGKEKKSGKKKTSKAKKNPTATKKPKTKAKAKVPPAGKKKAAKKIVKKPVGTKKKVAGPTSKKVLPPLEPMTLGKKKADKNQPQKNIPARPPTPVLKVILCGPHSIYWVPKTTKIHESLFEEGIHTKEKEISKEMKAPQRRDEFLRARWLYRRVAKIKDPLLRGKNGEPLWPENLLGSISHKDGHVLYCKATKESHFALGLDIEKVSKLSDQIKPKICLPEEYEIIDRVSALARLSRQEVLTLFFSFKEAIFKAHFPLGHKVFGFHDVKISEVAYDRREIFGQMNVETSPYSPQGHTTIGFYNWMEFEGEKFVVVVAEERKPLAVDKDLKEELLAEDDTQNSVDPAEKL